MDLSNAQDKAAQRAAERNLERQNLNGQKINTGVCVCVCVCVLIFSPKLCLPLAWSTCFDYVLGVHSYYTHTHTQTHTHIHAHKEESYEDEHSEFTIVAPPSEKAIFIIQMIMKKISEHCAAPE